MKNINLKIGVIIAVSVSLYVCALVKLGHPYIDWLDRFRGRWNVWSCVGFTLPFAFITIAWAFGVAWLCGRVAFGKVAFGK